MNWIEQLQNLDFNDIGRWPLPFRVLFVALIFILVAGASFYYLVYREKLPDLERAKVEETELKQTFSRKQQKAANLDAYKQQLDDIEQSFGTMLRQLPAETEIPSLLVDISQSGLAAGLEERLFQPASENPKEFYAEKPIKMQMTGNYHEVAKFVSSVANLPRIVTLHDIELRPDPAEDDQLLVDLTAKTYRYIDEVSE